MSVTSSESTAIAALSSVLVATDFSKGAEQALERALRLPLAAGATLHIVHVMNPPLFDAPLRKAEAQAAAAMKEAVARTKAAAKALGVKLSISGKVLSGKAFEEVVRHSRMVGADLIVLGRHGRRVVRDLFIGSTASRVIHYGDLPVLLVSRPARSAYARPIAAVDFDETTHRTLEVLTRVVGPAVHEITLVHAYYVPHLGPSTNRASETTLRKTVREQAAKKSYATISQLPSWGITWRRVIAHGDARQVVLNKARSHDADLIAVGTHARSGITNAFLGSVAEGIMTAASCDVLISRPTRFTFRALA